jgi:hypothetical protein
MTDEEDWQEALENAEIDDNRPASDILREHRGQDFGPVDENREIQCAECGEFVAGDEPLYDIRWRYCTEAGVTDYGTLWLCAECVQVLPGVR